MRSIQDCILVSHGDSVDSLIHSSYTVLGFLQEKDVHVLRLVNLSISVSFTALESHNE